MKSSDHSLKLDGVVVWLVKIRFVFVVSLRFIDPAASTTRASNNVRCAAVSADFASSLPSLKINLQVGASLGQHGFNYQQNASCILRKPYCFTSLIGSIYCNASLLTHLDDDDDNNEEETPRKVGYDD